MPRFLLNPTLPLPSCVSARRAWRWESRLVCAALWAAAGLVVAKAAESGEVRPALAGVPEVLLDDNAIVDRIETEGTALIKAGKVTRVRSLRAQLLQARTCALPQVGQPKNRPAPAIPTAEYYTRQTAGVLVVGVLARMKKRARYEVAACSGFALAADGVLVTNYHVIDSPEGEAIVVMSRDGQVAPVTEVLAADKLADVAIVRAAGATFSPLPLATETPAPGAPIWVISHPDHNFFCLTAGVISRYFVATTQAGKTPQMAVTADFGAGSSGGPIMDAEGRVLGIVCSTTSVYWQDEKGKVNDLQMVFKHCVPVASIRKLIDPPAP